MEVATTEAHSGQARQDGVAKHNCHLRLRLDVDRLVSFTIFPLRVWHPGRALRLLTIHHRAGVDSWSDPDLRRSTPGYALIMVVLLLLKGIILINRGIAGKYISQIFIKAKPAVGLSYASFSGCFRLGPQSWN